MALSSCRWSSFFFLLLLIWNGIVTWGKREVAIGPGSLVQEQGFAESPAFSALRVVVRRVFYVSLFFSFFPTLLLLAIYLITGFIQWL